MKILLQHSHAPGTISGVVTYCEAVRDMLAPHGVQVRIFSTHTDTWRGLWQAVRAADLVHLNSNHLRLLLIARLLGRPVLIKYHYPFWDELTLRPHTPLPWWRRLWRDTGFIWRRSALHWSGWRRWRHNALRLGRVGCRLWVARAADLRLACSEFVARSADLPFPVEVDYNATAFPAVCPPRRESAGRAPVFLYVGRLERPKGADLFLEAAALLAGRGRRLRASVVGHGADEKELMEMVRARGLEDVVEFVGQVPSERVRALMLGAHAVVVPSRCNDAAPYVIVEAAAAGRGCIGARVGGIPELIGEASLLFERGDARELASHMERLLDDPALAAAHGREAWERLRARCDHPVAAGRLLAFYRELLCARRGFSGDTRAEAPRPIDAAGARAHSSGATDR